MHSSAGAPDITIIHPEVHFKEPAHISLYKWQSGSDLIRGCSSPREPTPKPAHDRFIRFCIVYHRHVEHATVRHL